MTGFVARQARAGLLALQFLTILPVPKHLDVDDNLQGLSLLWYPAVGLILGLLLTLTCSMLPLPYSLQAILTVTLWIALTGGLHLDGVADCADAWVGGVADREKTLRLLKDPLCGSMGVIALIVVIALKYVALTSVIEGGQLCWFWVVPLLARTSLLCLFLTTRYVRDVGLGAVLAQHFPRAWAPRILVSVAVLLLFVLPLDVWCAFAMLTVAICLTIRWAAVRRLGGFTGDIAGAQIELVEVGLLLALASRTVV